MLYKDWLIEWLECYVKHSSKQRTYTRYSEIVHLHIIPSIGNYEIDDLNPFILQEYVTYLLTKGNLRNGKGLSVNSVNSIITVIQNSLKIARTIGKSSGYIADKIKRPKTQERQVLCFTIAEQRKIEKVILEEKKIQAVWSNNLFVYRIKNR